MTTKQRAYLKSLAMTMDPIFQIGKSSMTPSLTQAISEALDARELIKISVLQNLKAFLKLEMNSFYLLQAKCILQKPCYSKNPPNVISAV